VAVRDTDLLHQVLRFLLTVGLPVAAALEEGLRPWLVYAVLGAILAFLGDEGGRPLRRLGYMAIGPAGLVAGAAVGTAVVPLPVLFLSVLFALGLFYGLIEGRHAHLLLLTRFVGYGLVMGDAAAPLDLADCFAGTAAVVEAWIISLLWDLITGGWLRPLGVLPVWTAMKGALIGWRTRWTFALCAGVTIVAASLAGAWLNVGHPYWATLTILVVLRSELASSADLMTDRVLGTLMGVTAVALLIATMPGQKPILVSMVVAAALRWPAFRVHVALGTAAITAFVLLLSELLATTPQAAIHLLQDRLLATMVGCCFAMAGIGLYRNLPRYPQTPSAVAEP
jgi:hypothetical protein